MIIYFERSILIYFSLDFESVENSTDNDESDGDGNNGQNSNLKIGSERGRINVITCELAQALDAAKVSNYHAAMILAAAAKAMNVDVRQTNINVSSIRRRRAEVRNYIATRQRKEFVSPEILTVHWDGKIVPGLNDEDSLVDRQAIVVTGVGTEQFLGAPAVVHGTGECIAGTVLSHLQEWQIVKYVKAMSFDTTSVNSGNI